jgi:hypothetical protein
MVKEFSYNIEEEIAVLSENAKGYSKELNYISYNGAPKKLDIRTWSTDEDGEKRMGKGITLTNEEAAALRDALNELELD